MSPYKNCKRKTYLRTGKPCKKLEKQYLKSLTSPRIEKLTTDGSFDGRQSENYCEVLAENAAIVQRIVDILVTSETPHPQDGTSKIILTAPGTSPVHDDT